MPGVAAWIAELRAAGVGLCLVSNGLAPRIGAFAGRVDLPYVARAMKPLPHGVRAAMQKIGAQAAWTAMVGDQLFADVLAGRWAGIRTILVDPIGPEEEPWYTRLKRLPERVALRRAAYAENHSPSAGRMKILPSPIRPVRAASTMVLATSSTPWSSTQSVISTFGR